MNKYILEDNFRKCLWEQIADTRSFNIVYLYIVLSRLKHMQLKKCNYIMRNENEKFPSHTELKLKIEQHNAQRKSRIELIHGEIKILFAAENISVAKWIKTEKKTLH